MNDNINFSHFTWTNLTNYKETKLYRNRILALEETKGRIETQHFTDEKPDNSSVEDQRLKFLASNQVFLLL
jgi:hypothetical protein